MEVNLKHQIIILFLGLLICVIIFFIICAVILLSTEYHTKKRVENLERERREKIDKIDKLSCRPDVFTFVEKISEETAKEVKVLETERLYLIYIVNKCNYKNSSSNGFHFSEIYFCRKCDKIPSNTHNENASDITLTKNIVRISHIPGGIELKYKVAGTITFLPSYNNDNPVSRLVLGAPNNHAAQVRIGTFEFPQNQDLMNEAMDCTLNYFYKNDILKLDNGNEVKLRTEVKLENNAQKFHKNFGFEKWDVSYEPEVNQDHKMTKEIFNNPEKKENRERKIQDKINAEKNLKISSISSEINPLRIQYKK